MAIQLRALRPAGNRALAALAAPSPAAARPGPRLGAISDAKAWSGESESAGQRREERSSGGGERTIESARGYDGRPDAGVAGDATGGGAPAEARRQSLPDLGAVRRRLQEVAASVAGSGADVGGRYEVAQEEAEETVADEVAVAATGGASARGGAPAPTLAAPATAALDALQQGTGAPVDDAVRTAAEHASGIDLSGVRLHTGPAAMTATDLLGAQALSVGDHVALAEGVAPGTASGDALVAHELGHIAADVPQVSGPEPSGEAGAAGPEEAVAGAAPRRLDPEERQPEVAPPAEVGGEPPSPYRPGPGPRAGTRVHRAAALDPAADNAAVMRARADARVADLAGSTDTLVVGQAAQADGALSELRERAQGAVGSARQGITGVLDSNGMAVGSAFTEARAALATGATDAKVGVETEAIGAVQAADVAAATGAEAAGAELRGRSEAIAAEGKGSSFAAAGEAEIASIDAEARRVIASYADDDDAAEVADAVNAAAAEAVGTLREVIDGGQRDIAAATAEAGVQASGAAAGEQAKAQDAGRSAVDVLEGERVTAAEGIDAKVAEGDQALQAENDRAAAALDEHRAGLAADLQLVEGTAGAAIASAMESTAATYEAYRAQLTGGLEAWRGGFEEQLVALMSLVGNLFHPDDAEPVFEDLSHAVGDAEGDLATKTAALGQSRRSTGAAFEQVLQAGAASRAGTLGAESQQGLAGLSQAQQAAGAALGGLPGVLTPGFAGIVGELGTVIEGMLRGVGLAGDDAEQQVASAVTGGSVEAEAEVRATGSQARAELHEVAADATGFLGGSEWFDWLVDGFVTVLEAVGKSVVNLLTGFLWGDPVWEDYGGKWFAFVGDVIAGVLVYGDLRDLFKWIIWKPLVMGEEWTWENWLMIGLAAFGLVPTLGDITKGVVKFLKVAVRSTAKELVEQLGQELAEKLVKELGEEGARQLVDALGEKVAKDLLGHVEPTVLAQLLKAVGAGALQRWAGKGPDLARMVTALGVDDVATLAKDLDPLLLVNVVDTLGVDVAKEVAADGGAAVLKELLRTIDLDTLRKLTSPEFGWSLTKRCRDEFGADVFADLLAKFTLTEISHLRDLITPEVVVGLVGEIGIDGLRKLLDVFTIPRLQFLLRESGLSGTQLKHLAELGAGLLDEIPVELLGAAAALAGRLPLVVLRRVLGHSRALIGEAIENLMKDPGGNLLEAYDVLGYPVTEELADAIGGEDAVADLVGDVGAASVKEMLAKCWDADQFARLLARYGSGKALQTALAGADHADELEESVPAGR